MRRRDVLRWGAAGASGAVLGCAPQPASPGAPSVTAADLEMLAKMEAVVRGIRSATPDPKHYGGARPETLAANHALVAKSLGAMHTVATLSELSVETQRHPDVQRRMWAALPDIHDATMSMADRLDAMSPEERRRVDERIRTDDGLPMKIFEVLDDEAKARGIPDAHRFRMRTIATHVAWRLKAQGAGAVLDDLVGKVDRVVARRGADAQLERAVAAKVADAQLFGFPPTGDSAPVPTDTPVANEPAPVVAEGNVLRARFRTNATAEAVQRITCQLQARIALEGKQRPLDLRLVQDGAEAACGTSSSGEPIRGAVRLRRESDAWDVMLEIEVPDTISETGRQELRGALRDIGGELRRRVLATERSTTTVAQQQQQPAPTIYGEPKAKTRSSSKVLTASAIVWGIGLGTAAIGGVMIAAGQHDSGLIIGGAFVLTVASLLAVAGIITLIIAGAMYSSGN